MAEPCETRFYEIPSFQLAANGFHLDLITQLYEKGKIDRRTMLWLGLAVQEAVANSLEHGNLELDSAWKEEIDDEGIDRFTKEKYNRLKIPKYANRMVRIQVIHAKDLIEVEIRDEGKGVKSVPKEVLPNDTPHGKGFAMIRAGVDEMEVTNKGRGIRLLKRF